MRWVSLLGAAPTYPFRSKDRSVIPKKLHLVWIGEDGTRPEAAIDTWRQANPEWDIRVWNNADLAAGEWSNRDHLKAMLAHDLGGVMTLMRYEILLAEGGVAADALSIARQPLDDWLRCEDFACWVDEHDQPGMISAGFLGAEPGSAFLQRLLNDLRQQPSLTDRAVEESVGSWQITRTWRAGRFPLALYPSHFFASTVDDICTYTGSGIVFGEHLASTGSVAVEPPDAVIQGSLAVPNTAADPAEQTDHRGAGYSGDVPAPTTTKETHVSSTPAAPGNDDLAAKIAALKAELDAEPGPKQGSWAGFGAVEPTSLINPGSAVAPVSMPAELTGTSDSTLAELSRQLRDTAAVPDTITQKTFRMVVATDWSSATVPLAVLRAYSTMFNSDAPVELVFAVPQEPTQNDLGAVKVLFEGLEGVENTAALQIEAFSEVTSNACYAAIVPSGDPEALIMELSVFFTQMHHLADLVRDQEKLREEPTPVAGFNTGLSHRLAEFAGA